MRKYRHTIRIWEAQAGRPLKFKTPEELQEAIEDYFASTPHDEWTVTGLALAIDTTRDLLDDYADFNEFSHLIKNAKQKIRLNYEKRAIKKGRPVDMFLLKNFGYKDKQEISQKISGDVKLTDLFNLRQKK